MHEVPRVSKGAAEVQSPSSHPDHIAGWGEPIDGHIA
jgi:hypothetical protein